MNITLHCFIVNWQTYFCKYYLFLPLFQHVKALNNEQLSYNTKCSSLSKKISRIQPFTLRKEVKTWRKESCVLHNLCSFLPPHMDLKWTKTEKKPFVVAFSFTSSFTALDVKGSPRVRVCNAAYLTLFNGAILGQYISSVFPFLFRLSETSKTEGTFLT